MAVLAPLLGAEPQSTYVTAYQATALTPALRIGEKEDLYVRDGTVVVLGLDSGGGASKAEFEFDAAHDASATPKDVVDTVLQPLSQALVHGVNGLLLVLGTSGSGKTELVHGQQETNGWVGLMGNAIETVLGALPHDALSAAEDRYQLRAQFLSIVDERVQDLLQPNCHAHDLQLVERPGRGIEVVGADEAEVRSPEQGIRLFQSARDMLHRLARYHGVDASAQTNLMRLALHRVGTPPGGGGGGMGPPISIGELRSSITIIDLPGTERLAEDPSRMRVTQELHARTSIRHFSELVQSLSSRVAAEHVARRGGKLSILLADRLGTNALVHCIATIRPGQARLSAATLECATALRRVQCFPVVNSTAARGLQANCLSEIIALRDSLRTLSSRARVRLGEQHDGAADGAADGAVVAGFSADRGAGDLTDVDTLTPANDAFGKTQQGSVPAAPVSGAGALLHQSAEMGQRIQDEIHLRKIDDHRKDAIREKAELQKAFDQLLKDKHKAEQARLEAEVDKLQVAKSLVDLQVEDASKEKLSEELRIEFDHKLDGMRRENIALSDEKSKLENDVKTLTRQVLDSQSETEDLLSELVAARASLEKSRQEGQTLQSEARERDLEIVRSVKQAEQQLEKNEAQGQALASSRGETDAVRAELHQTEARCAALEAEVAGLRRESATARAQREELQLAARRAAVQRELFEVSVNKEKAKLELDRQQLRDDLEDEKRLAREAEAKEVKAEREAAARRATELIEVRADLHQLREKHDSVSARCEELEREVDDSERRLQAANEAFRATLQEALSVHFTGNRDPHTSPDNSSGERASSENNEEITAQALLQALRDAYEQHESHLLNRLTNLQRRQWSTLDKARREAAAAETRGKKMGSVHAAGGLDRASPRSSRRVSVARDSRERANEAGGEAQGSRAALQAIAAADEEAAMSALQAEGRAVLQAYVEEVAQLRTERGALRGELQAAAVASRLAAASMAEERQRLLKEVSEARGQAEAALRSLHESGGENASVKLLAVGTKSREAQRELLEQLGHISTYREKLLVLKVHEKEETGCSFAEVRLLRAELDALRNELKERLQADPHKVANLRMQIREFHVTCAQLEHERSHLMRRASNAEQQLDTLQATLATSLARYQQEIVRLRGEPRLATGR